VEHTIYSGIH